MSFPLNIPEDHPCRCWLKSSTWDLERKATLALVYWRTSCISPIFLPLDGRCHFLTISTWLQSLHSRGREGWRHAQAFINLVRHTWLPPELYLVRSQSHDLNLPASMEGKCSLPACRGRGKWIRFGEDRHVSGAWKEGQEKGFGWAAEWDREWWPFLVTRRWGRGSHCAPEHPFWDMSKARVVSQGFRAGKSQKCHLSQSYHFTEEETEAQNGEVTCSQLIAHWPSILLDRKAFPPTSHCSSPKNIGATPGHLCWNWNPLLVP